MKNISRREFIKQAALTTASIYAGTAIKSVNAAHMGGGGAVTIINPPVGSLLKDPATLPNQSTTPGIVDVGVDATIVPTDVNGKNVNLLTYNDYFPGATIRDKKDDILRLKLKNSLPADGAVNFLGNQKYITNMHTHGLHVSPGDNANGTHSDNMMVMLMPGDETVYEYDLSKQDPGSLNFYHPHVHGCVADQMWAGMAGALVIEDDITVLSNYETHILILKDIELSGSEPAPYTSTMEYMHGKEGNTVMVNGQVNPLLYVRPGQVQRWRVVNASTARFYKLSLESHAMYLIGTDGGLLDKPYRVNDILVAPGERVDLLVKATKSSGTYKLLSLAYDRGMNNLQTVILMTVSYRDKKVTDVIPSSINPNSKRLTIDTSALPVQKMVLSMRHGRGYINGRTFISHEDCYTIMSMTDSYEVWEIINESGMDHPFHHHTNLAQVLSISGGEASYAQVYTSAPAWKDCTIVPKWGNIKLLMPVMDFTGHAMVHCHIIEHEDVGMIAMWHIMGDMM